MTMSGEQKTSFCRGSFKASQLWLRRLHLLAMTTSACSLLLFHMPLLKAGTLEPPADSQKVGAIFSLVLDKQRALDKTEKQALEALQQMRLGFSHLLTHAYTLRRITQLQRRYGEEPAAHKKAYLRLVLKRLLRHKVKAIQSQHAHLTYVQNEKIHLDQIAQTLHFRAQAWVNTLEG